MTTPPRVLTTDVLILGAGAAGLHAAVAVRAAGKRALIVSKTPAGKSTNTVMAGGIFPFPTDVYPEQEHLACTLASGAGHRARRNPTL